MTDDDTLERFMREHCAYNGVSEDRQSEMRRVLGNFQRRAGRPLIEATSADVSAFLADCVADGFHPNTVRKWRNMIMPFYRWAHRTGRIDRLRMLDIRDVPSPRGATSHGVPRPYTRDEVAEWWTNLAATYPLDPHFFKRWQDGRSPYRRIYRHANRLQLQAIGALALFCGLRRNELLYASLNDTHPDNAYVVVRHAARKNPQAETRPREVPMPVAVSDLLRPWFEFRKFVNPKHDSVWLSLAYLGEYTWAPLREPRLYSLLGSVPKAEGTWELHRFRHTCATEWLRARMPLHELQVLMGHGRIEQTLEYARIARADLRETAARLESRFVGAVGPGEGYADDRAA